MVRISTVFILISALLIGLGEITLSMQAVTGLLLTVGILFLGQDIIDLNQENNVRKMEKELYDSYMQQREDTINEADATRDFNIEEIWKENK